MCKRFILQQINSKTNVENSYVAHHMINVGNGRAPGFCRDNRVRFADVVISKEGLSKAFVLIGRKDICKTSPFTVFRNTDCNYPFWNDPDTLLGDSHQARQNIECTEA